MNIPDFIEIYDNAVSLDTCQTFIDYYENLEKISLGVNHRPDLSTNVKDKSVLIPDALNVNAMNYLHGDTVEVFRNSMQNCYNMYSRKYDALKNLDSHGLWTIKIQKTCPGEGYHIWHCENDKRETNGRVLVWMLYLNEGFEGGETEFLYQQRRITPKAGSMLIWPSSFTHIHRGNPPIGGIKYAATGWLEY